MDAFFTWLEKGTEKRLTKRKALKLYNKRKKRTVVSEALEWLDALVFGVFWVIILNQFIFQLFVIPSPSMVDTLLVGDRVVVYKDSYGVELYPGGPKAWSGDRRVQRDDIITFYNPEYESKGPFFDILSQALYMGTLSLVNIDRNADGTPAERLYVKRAAAMAGDNVYFRDGNVLIRPQGYGSYVEEEEFRADLSLSTGPSRLVPEDKYPGLKAASRASAMQEKGLGYPQYLADIYLGTISGTDWDYRFDIYEYRREYALTLSQIEPENYSYRSAYSVYRTGIYVPDGYVLPLGDNRDNSQDGRYFGPVSEEKINGRVVFRFWPLSRVSLLTDS